MAGNVVATKTRFHLHAYSMHETYQNASEQILANVIYETSKRQKNDAAIGVPGGLHSGCGLSLRCCDKLLEASCRGIWTVPLILHCYVRQLSFGSEAAWLDGLLFGGNRRRKRFPLAYAAVTKQFFRLLPSMRRILLIGTAVRISFLVTEICLRWTAWKFQVIVVGADTFPLGKVSNRNHSFCFAPVHWNLFMIASLNSVIEVPYCCDSCSCFITVLALFLVCAMQRCVWTALAVSALLSCLWHPWLHLQYIRELHPSLCPSEQSP